MKTDLLEAGAMRWVNIRRRSMKAKINGDDRRWRRTVYGIGVRLLVALCLISLGTWGPEPWGYLAGILLGCIAGAYFCMSSVDRTQAYTDGWHDGRRAMHDSYHEASERGIGIYDWWDAERDKTWGTPL